MRDITRSSSIDLNTYEGIRTDSDEIYVYQIKFNPARGCIYQFIAATHYLSKLRMCVRQRTKFVCLCSTSVNIRYY